MKKLLLWLLLAAPMAAQVNVSGGSSAPTGSFNVLPTVVSVGANGSAGAGSTLSVPPPASIVNGNPIYIVVFADAINPTWAGPVGFSQIGSTISSSASHITNGSVWCKVASSESGNYVFTISSPSGGESLLLGWAIQLTGTSCTPDSSATITGNAAVRTINSFATNNANDLVMVMAKQNGTGAGVLSIQVPGGATKQAQAGNSAIYTFANGFGNTPTITMASTQSGGAPAVTDDTVMFALALAPTTTVSTNPFVANSSSAAATLDSLHVTGTGVQVDKVLMANTIIIPNCPSSATTAQTGQLQAVNLNGVPIGIMCMNTAGNLFLGWNNSQVTIGTGTHGAGNTPTLMLSSGSLDFITNDSSQDEAIFTTDVSDQLYYGSFAAADTLSGDTFFNARTGKFMHFTNGTGVYGGPGDIFALGGSGLVGGVPIVAIATPGAPTVTATCPNGTCTSTWGYKIFCTDSNSGGTPASAEATTAVNAATLDGTHFNTITWASTAGCKTYKVFRSTVATSPATTGIIGTVTTGSTSNVAKPFSFVDNNIAGDSSTAPATNTTGTMSAVRLQPANIATVAGGAPALVYNTASASVNANITATTMVTAPATNANCPSGLTANCSVYELSWYIDVSAVGTSCAGATTVVFNVLYTDPLGAGQQTVASSTITVAATNGTLGTIVANGNQVLVAKLSTTVQYSTTSFTAGGSCSPAPKYQITPILKQIS